VQYDAQGHVLFESSVVSAKLSAAGVPDSAIINDWMSWDTVNHTALHQTMYDHSRA
jgi:hypothetical protein